MRREGCAWRRMGRPAESADRAPGFLGSNCTSLRAHNVRWDTPRRAGIEREAPVAGYRVPGAGRWVSGAGRQASGVGRQASGVGRQTIRRRSAQRVSSWREESWSLRSTFETWVSTVLIEMNSSPAISR